MASGVDYVALGDGPTRQEMDREETGCCSTCNLCVAGEVIGQVAVNAGKICCYCLRCLAEIGISLGGI